MKLALNVGYWGLGNDSDNLAVARGAEQLGYSSVWVAEAYGSDAVSVLSWIGAQTSTIGLGTAILQIPARTPAMTAMTAATLDTLSGGRVLLGLGVSGPQVSEGSRHGVRYDKPMGRTREYIEIVRQALTRERLRYDGKHYTLPLPDGPGKALQLTVHPVREHIPIYLAAIGPKNLELTGEIADGVLSVFFATGGSSEVIENLSAGRAKVGKTMAGFDVVASMPLVVSDDPESAVAAVRGYYALYIGGMGSRERNFYNQLAGRLGYAEEAKRVQDAYLARDYAAAQAAVPFGLIDQTSLVGNKERIAERMKQFAQAGVTTLSLMPAVGDADEKLSALKVASEALSLAGLAGLAE